MINERIIGERITSLREQRQLSRTMLAEIMAVSPQAVGKWERGESMPDILTLKKLSEVFEVNVDAFFDDLGVCAENAVKAVKTDDASAAKPSWNLSVSNWKNADFSGLSNIADKFRYANIIGCNFTNSVLIDINFASNCIKNSTFVGANLSGSTLKMSNIPNCNFKNSNMTNVTIKYCDLHGSDFSGTDFTGAKIHGVSLNKNPFYGAVFNGTTFDKCILNRIDITDNITDCSFIDCIFKNVAFKNMTFTNTFFKNHKHRRVTFENCRADSVSYSFLKHSQVDLSGLTLL